MKVKDELLLTRKTGEHISILFRIKLNKTLKH